MLCLLAFCNRPRASPALVSTGTGHYDVCFVLPPILSCTISFGAATCSLTHSLSSYHCPLSCSLYCLCMGKLSLLSQSYFVPFYSERALQTYLQRREPLLMHIQLVQWLDNMLR